MNDKRVAVLETRTGAHLGELIARRGGIPLLAPALSEVPDIEPADVIRLIETWRSTAYRAVIFQTGVGTRALFSAAESVGADLELRRLLATATVVVRGPKPTGELGARQVRIDLRAASPFTTENVLGALRDTDLDRAAVLVQRYGAVNTALSEGLLARGARQVDEIATYRWALPLDTAPLEHFLDELAAARVDAVVFTSAVQIDNLFAVAQSAGRADSLAEQLNAVVVASIGPVCSRALEARGIRPTFQADPPKLGPLLARLEVALSVTD